MITPKNTKFRVSFRNKFTQNELKPPKKQKTNKILRTIMLNVALGQGVTVGVGNHPQSQSQSQSHLSFNKTSQLYDTRAALPYFKPKTQKLSTHNNSKTKLWGTNHSRGLNYASNTKLLFGNYGFVFETNGVVSAKLVTTMRNNIRQLLKKRGKIWLRLCCDTPVTARPIETRMGKGKGSVSYWAGRIRRGQIYFELEGSSLVKLLEIENLLQKKSPYALRLIGSKN